MKKILFALLLIADLCAYAQDNSNPPAQGQSPQTEQRRGGMRGRGVGGAIQSINGDTLTLTARDGSTVTVKTTADTRFMKDGQPAKLSDFKVGDRVFIGGVSSSPNTWTADMVGTGIMMRRGEGQGQGQGQGAGGGAMMERMREGLGKEFVAGELKSIDGTTLVVHGPDGKDYTAQVDENTSFHRGRDSITFPEIKVGDRVMGRGKVNDSGVFVFQSVNVGGFGGGRNREGAQPSAQPKQ